MTEPLKLLVLVPSPRRAGNSATLARAVRRGAEAIGAQVSLRFIDDFISSFLRDCRLCRLPSGECSIADRFRMLFFEDFIPAPGVVFCSPVYWYGLSAQMKAFFDRTFCYYAASYSDSARVIDGMSHKRIGLVLASEETYPGVSLGIVHQRGFRSSLITRIPSLLGLCVASETAVARSLMIQATRFLPRNSSGAKSFNASILIISSTPNGMGEFGRLNCEPMHRIRLTHSSSGRTGCRRRVRIFRDVRSEQFLARKDYPQEGSSRVPALVQS
jgi:multimeric flavodoxin WrbA